MEKLDEVCQIIKFLFSEKSILFEGQYYWLKEVLFEFKLVQFFLFFLIGGGGEKVMFKIIVKYVDEWNVWGDVDFLKYKMEIFDGYCRDVGCDLNDIQWSVVVFMFLSKDNVYIDYMKG